MSAPQALVICGDGINCDLETVHVLNLVGFQVKSLHVTELLKSPKKIEDVHMVCIPGGFSFGDEIASGKVLALKLATHLQEAMQKFINDKRLVMGICNGFQVLTQLGLLPFPQAGAPRVVSLARNREKRFHNKWVSLDVSKSKSADIFFKGLERIDLPIRHGEGNLTLEPLTPEKTENSKNTIGDIASTVKNLASLRYVDDVNGSFDRIAALSSEDGTVMGLMPHPEAFIRFTQHPCWTEWRSVKKFGNGSAQHGAKLHERQPAKPDGLVVFENALRYCQSI